MHWSALMWPLPEQPRSRGEHLVAAPASAPMPGTAPRLRGHWGGPLTLYVFGGSAPRLRGALAGSVRGDAERRNSPAPAGSTVS